jgi:hypothetical protein
MSVVFGERATELAEALITDGERGFGDVGFPGAKQYRGVVETKTAEVDGRPVSEFGGEKAAEMRGTAVDGSGELGQPDGVGKMRAHEVDRRTDCRVANSGGGRCITDFCRWWK